MGGAVQLQFPAQFARASLKRVRSDAPDATDAEISRAICAGLIEAVVVDFCDRCQLLISRAICAGLIEASILMFICRIFS